MDECPIDALEDALLNGLLVAVERPYQVLHVRLHKEDLSLLLLAEGVELEHLNEALAGFLDDGKLEVV